MYDFDTVINRAGTYSLKWDVKEGELPMWVADMDFETAPEIKSALERRVSHGVFGYSILPDEWYDAYISWWKRRYDFLIQKEWLDFCTGVIPAISSIVRKLTTPNENVLIMTPVYDIFFNSVINNGARVLECPLQYKNGNYDIDFNDLEAKLSDPQTSLMLLCNPQNPAGKIWSEDELGKIGLLCQKYNVTVVSDEIHCDLTDPGRKYTPFASVSSVCRDISITCMAPTKTFNIGGLQTAAVCIPNGNLRHKVWRAINTDEVAEPNAFAVTAAIAAYNTGEAWLDELRQYIYDNKILVQNYIKENLPEVLVTPSCATYLLWLDVSAVCEDSGVLRDSIRKRTGLYLSAGAIYGGNGIHFLRMNIACPRKVLSDGLNRLKEGIASFGNAS